MSAATTTRAVIYCRVSTDEQAAQGKVAGRECGLWLPA